jgi:hypothetical protein
MAHKPDVEILLGPPRSDFRPMLGVTFAVSIFVHIDRPRAAPKRRGSIRVKWWIRLRPNALDCLILGEGAAGES